VRHARIAGSVTGSVLLGLDGSRAFTIHCLTPVLLLERHARPGVPPSRGDYLFVLVCLATVFLLALLPIVLFVWLLSQFPLV
jgi:hypothetical protein